MFGLFSKEKFSCFGVNPDADWSYMDSIITPMSLHQYLKSKIYTKAEIKEIQNKLNEKGIVYRNILNEFNWIPQNQASTCNMISYVSLELISGVRNEFDGSQYHHDIYEKFIAPTIIKSLSLGLGKIKYDIEEIKSEYLDKGVIVPLHFDRVLVIDSKIKDEKTGLVFRNLEIKEKLEPFSLEPNSYQKIDVIIDKMLERLKKSDMDIAEEEKELMEILTEDDNLKGRYAEVKAYYYLGMLNMKIGLTDQAEKYFDILINLKPDVSKTTIARDFFRPIGELYEERGINNKALVWYKRAIELSPAIGLKNKIKQLEA